MIPTDRHAAVGPTPRSPLQRWQVFSATPHRMLMFAGSCQLVLTLLWWSAELVGRYTDAWPPSATVIASTWAHQFLMLYGIFPFFILGFLFTVYPRWMRGPPVGRRLYVSVFALLSVGAVLFYGGLFTLKGLVAAAVASVLCGWAVAVFGLLRVYRRAETKGVYERIVNATLAAAAAGMGLYLLALLSARAAYFALAGTVGLWLFLLPLMFTVAHRMIPFFSGAVLADYALRRPAWSLALMLACVSGHALLEALGLLAWRFLFDLPLLLAALYLTLVWQFRRSLAIPLLATLHIAFLWFSVALALYNVQSLALLATGELILGRAPLHAFGIGFLTTMVLAMASRVTLGHSGRALAADHLTWYAFLGINVAALLRIGAELAPGGESLLNLAAAALWLASAGTWVARYAPIYWQPRVDGKPG